MVGEWVSYMRSDSCDSLQVNYRIHLLCQGTVHSEGVHFDTVQIQYVSPRLDNVHFVMWIGSVEVARVHIVCMELVMVDNVDLDGQAWNNTTHMEPVKAEYVEYIVDSEYVKQMVVELVVKLVVELVVALVDRGAICGDSCRAGCGAGRCNGSRAGCGVGCGGGCGGGCEGGCGCGCGGGCGGGCGCGCGGGCGCGCGGGC